MPYGQNGAPTTPGPEWQEHAKLKHARRGHSGAMRNTPSNFPFPVLNVHGHRSKVGPLLCPTSQYCHISDCHNIDKPSFPVLRAADASQPANLNSFSAVKCHQLHTTSIPSVNSKHLVSKATLLAIKTSHRSHRPLHHPIVSLSTHPRCLSRSLSPTTWPAHDECLSSRLTRHAA